MAVLLRATRILLPLALLLVIRTAWSSAAESPNSASVEDRAIQRVLELASTRCFVYGHAGPEAEGLQDLSQRALQRGAAGGWLDVGQAWIGDLAGAASALEADIVGEASGEAWVIHSDPPLAIQLKERTSFDGLAIWQVADSIQPIPCDELEE